MKGLCRHFFTQEPNQSKQIKDEQQMSVNSQIKQVDLYEVMCLFYSRDDTVRPARGPQIRIFSRLSGTRKENTQGIN